MAQFKMISQKKPTLAMRKCRKFKMGIDPIWVLELLELETLVGALHNRNVSNFAPQHNKDVPAK
jgi:hypothetical protein